MDPAPSSENGSLSESLQDHFVFLYAVALSDLHLDPAELERLYEIGRRRGVPKAKIDDVILHPNRARPAVPDDVLERVEYLYDFALMVQADGVVDDAERRMVERLCGVFGFVEENAHDIADFLLERAAAGTAVEAVLAEAAAAA